MMNLKNKVSKVKVCIDDESKEFLMNLVAQEYYGEAWEFITLLTDEFNKGLYVISARPLKAFRFVRGRI